MTFPHRFTLSLIALLAFVSPAWADDAPPLQLGSEHLGMTSEGLADVERHAETDHVVDQAIEKSEWTDEDLAEEGFIADDRACECPAPPTAEATPAAAPMTVQADGVTDYNSCVEVAIRSGNGFKPSSAVCQALFPDPPEAAAAGDAAPGAAQTATARTPGVSASRTTY